MSPMNLELTIIKPHSCAFSYFLPPTLQNIISSFENLILNSHTDDVQYTDVMKINYITWVHLVSKSTQIHIVDIMQLIIKLI